MSPRIEVWAAVELGYSPKDSDTEKYAKQDFIDNAKAMNALFSSLCESEFIKVMHSLTTKEI